MNKYKDKELDKEQLADSIYQGLSYNMNNNDFDNFTFVNQDFN